MGTRYELPPDARIRVLSASGGVTVTAEDRLDVEVEPAGRSVELKESGRHRHRHRHRHIHGLFERLHGGRGETDPPQATRPVLEVKSKSGNIVLRCPLGTDVSVGAMSGNVKLIGTFGSVKISTVSGGIEIDTTRGNVDARAVSGSVMVRNCGGRCDISSKSGNVRLERVEGPVHASTISGGVELGTAGQDEVELKMVSGRAKVKVLAPKNPRVRFQSISGKLRCDCPQGSDFDLNVKSISGSLEVTG